MNIQTKGTNVQLTNNVKRYLDKRVSSLEKYINPDDSSVKCQVEVEKTTEHHKKGDIYRSEINMRIAKAKFRAEATAEKLKQEQMEQEVKIAAFENQIDTLKGSIEEKDKQISDVSGQITTLQSQLVSSSQASEALKQQLINQRKASEEAALKEVE